LRTLKNVAMLSYEIVEGGATRFDSVKNGIHAIKNANANDIVLIHDAARPNIEKALIDRLVSNIAMNQITIPVWPINDSIRKKTSDSDSIVVDRKDLFVVQTPQAAFYQDIFQAFQQVYHESFTDEATVMERDFCAVKLMEGTAENIKVTTPEQIALIEFYLKNNSNL
jgi:2-C-methyl-D-erythritol 4-phosphate cytidylyltransferase